MSLFLITTPRNRSVFIEQSELFMWLNDRFTIAPFDHHTLFENIVELDVSSERKLHNHIFRKVGGSSQTIKEYYEVTVWGKKTQKIILNQPQLKEVLAKFHSDEGVRKIRVFHKKYEYCGVPGVGNVTRSEKIVNVKREEGDWVAIRGLDISAFLE
ncbi:MAG: hypothetical protein ACW963_01880 [Candidatus Sifarchaeia archaeon]